MEITLYLLKKKGYTLLEIIIILTILSMIIISSLAYYNQFTLEKILETDVEKLISVLNLAKTKSTSADQTPNLNCTDFNGYKVSSDNKNSYYLSFCCQKNCSTVLKTYKFSQKNYISSGSFDILFSPLSGEVTTNTVITLTNDKDFYNVCVSESGLVNVSKNSPCSF